MRRRAAAWRDAFTMLDELMADGGGTKAKGRLKPASPVSRATGRHRRRVIL